MTNRVNYQQLKMLFDINEETYNVYKLLAYTINEDSKNILYIFETYEEAKRKYAEIAKRFKLLINREDKRNGFIELKNKERIYIWTIGRIINPLDGYRFKDIRIG